MAFFFSREGPTKEFGATVELADAPEVIEMPMVLWQEARCAGVEDFAAAAEGFAVVGTGAA